MLEPMKKIIRYLIFLCLLNVLILCPVPFLMGEEEPLSQKHFTILKNLEGKIKSNYQTIYSWQGVAEFQSSTSWNQSERLTFTRSEILFCSDKVKNRYVSLIRFKEHWNSPKENTKNRENMPLEIIGRILTDNFDYLFSSRDPNGPLPPGAKMTDNQSNGLVTIRVRAVDLFPVNETRFFNPEKMLNDNTETGMAGLMDYLSGTIKIGKEDVLKGCTLEQIGDTIIYRSKKPYGSDHPNINIFTFDLSKGGLVTSREYIDPKGTCSRFDGELVKTNGVWHYKVLDWKMNNQLIYRTKLIKSLINQPIDEKLFTLQGIGVKQGDLVTDTIKGTASVILDPAFDVPITKESLRRTSYIRFTLIVLGSFLIIFSIILKFYQYRNKNK
jgi:hypothetical protein